MVLFFLLYAEFQKNWAGIQSHGLKFDPYFTFLAFAAMLATYLLTTYGWYLTLNTLSGGNRISFRDSVAIVNTSSLTKYLPGKVWSYALQTYWLARKGFPGSLIVFVYFINMLTLILTFLIVGLFYLAVSPGELPLKVIVSSLIGLVALDIFFIKYYSTLFNAFVSSVNRIFKRDITYYEAQAELLLRLHLVHAVSAFSFGACGYLMCLGIGFDIARDSICLIMSSMILSDMIGFLSLIVPSGLGVREGIMYLMLKGDAFGALSLVLPVATRIVIVVVDIFLGAAGFVLLKNYKTKREVAHDGKQAL
jgi:hypothetical protein